MSTYLTWKHGLSRWFVWEKHDQSFVKCLIKLAKIDHLFIISAIFSSTLHNRVVQKKRKFVWAWCFLLKSWYSWMWSSEERRPPIEYLEVHPRKMLKKKCKNFAICLVRYLRVHNIPATYAYYLHTLPHLWLSEAAVWGDSKNDSPNQACGADDISNRIVIGCHAPHGNTSISSGVRRFPRKVEAS